MPPKIIPEQVTCDGCDDLRSNYVGLIGHGSDCYSQFSFKCTHPKIDKWNNRINESLKTPDWCPYLNEATK